MYTRGVYLTSTVAHGSIRITTQDRLTMGISSPARPEPVEGRFYPSWFDGLTTTVTQFNIILTGGDDCLHCYPLFFDGNALYY